MDVTLRRRLHYTSDWLAASAGILTVAAAAYLWFAPGGAGTSCTGTLHGSSCQSLPYVLSTGVASFVLTPLVVALAVLLAGLLFHYRRKRLFLGGFGAAVVVFLVASFGIDWPFLPAAVFSIIAACLPPIAEGRYDRN
ncbi:hypothetical protein [Sulfobacillus harzensis]|uniref:Uncharacterized protein n=1 Tax=Sulfobacillus harzensis TaxID=2729629 RepID=A0A7Y0Q474_9FIRM|nr:hypothetical protein [Sulfobacillus harzensis]NMP22939.1 hypothetical protein [Sulfobacillus harzensis]